MLQSPLHTAPTSARSELRAAAVLLLACVGSRLLTTVYYIEDTDSLRFALSVYDGFDVTQLQPHFPGYPVFWALAKLAYLLLGSYARAFSLVGGLATFVLAWYLPRLFGLTLRDRAGQLLAAFVCLNPLLWLMGNRYMPDLAGVALLVAALYFLARRPHVGFLLAGLLAGLRLSYLPFLFLPVLMAGWHARRRWPLVGWGAAGVLVWLVPFLLHTGFEPLAAAAQRQTVGHFTEFGGTIDTVPHTGQRIVRTLESLWADGLGGYWPGRSPLTLAVGAGLLLLIGIGATYLRALPVARRTWWMIVTGTLSYGLWMLLYQNVLYKSRHVLPLLPLLLLPAALGAAALLGTHRRAATVIVAATLLAYGAVTLVLVGQHRQPTAIAQVQAHALQAARQAEGLTIASIPLVLTYLSAQQVPAAFASVEDPADVQRLRASVGRRPVMVVGVFPGLLDAVPARVDTFYHNPYINRMWPEVTVYHYAP